MKKLPASFLLFLLFASSPAFSKTLRYGDVLCEEGPYTCLEIQEGDTWQTLWPDEQQRDIVRRLNRMNVKLRPGMRIAVPSKLESTTKMEIAPFPKKIDPLGQKQIQVDLKKLAWGAYDAEGNLVDWGPAAGGKAFCSDVGYRCRTPDGDYHVLRKGKASCKSSKFPIPRGGAPMPYCMHFKTGGYALHGSYEVPGYNASHGCVRLYPADAKWLNQEFAEPPNKENSYQGTSVIVLPYSDPVLKKAETAPQEK